MKHHVVSIQLLFVLAVLLIVSCVLVDGGGSSSTTTTSASSADNTGDETGDPDPTTGDLELCMYHCFLGPVVHFPYTDEPLDMDGNPNGALLQCANVNGGSAISLVGVDLAIREQRCPTTQAVSQEVMDLGICDPGPVPQPPSAEWDEWASTWALAQQRACVVTLVEEHDCHPSPVGQQGAEEVCRYFLQYPLYYETLAVSPQFEQDEPLMGEMVGDDCDYNMMLECSGADESSGGELLPFGDVDELVDCNGSFTSCVFDSELEDHIVENTSRLYDDGVRLIILQSDDPDYPGVRIVLPNHTPDSASEDLLQAFGFRDADVIRAANGTFLTSEDHLYTAFMSLFDTGTTTARVVRAGQVLRIQALERK